MPPSDCHKIVEFQSTHSLRSATSVLISGLFPGGCFNPRTPCGVRPARASCPSSCLPFQSTHSLRSATNTKRKKGNNYEVSIHALLAECDYERHIRITYQKGFNPRTPCGVRRGIRNRPARFHLFQSTHSLRSATLVSFGIVNVPCGFNPRTPCGVRPAGASCPSSCSPFQSTHSLRSATVRWPHPRSVHWFQSTHSLRSATVYHRHLPVRRSCFNPRTPCGVRLGIFWHCKCSTWFQSTHSLRSATNPADIYTFLQTVSIHALLAECDGDSPGQQKKH